MKAHGLESMVELFEPATAVTALKVGFFRLATSSHSSDLGHGHLPCFCQTKFLPALWQKGILWSMDGYLRQVSGDQLGHLEHGDGAFAAEHLLELVVGVDVALVLGVLEIVLLDVDPESLDYL